MLPLLWSGILSRCEESVKRMPVLRASAKVKGVLVSLCLLQEQDGRSERTLCFYSFFSFLQLKLHIMTMYHVLGTTSYTLPPTY